MRNPKTTASIYQLKVTLKGSKPPVWRRVLVPSDVTLDVLHEIIQSVMGWHNCHLHLFEIDGVEYSLPSPDWEELGQSDERRVRLAKALRGVGSKMKYEYDYGDSWEHAVLLEKVLPREEGMQYPRCVAGKRACPPEDVGGIWAYAGFLEAIADPTHEDHDEMLEWVGGSFDPEQFSIDEVNATLKRYRL